MPSNSEDLGDESDGNALIPFPILVFLEASLALLALVLGSILGINPLSEFDWTTRALIQGLAATLPLIGLLWLSNRWRIEAILEIRDFLRRELLPYLRETNALDLAMLSLAAGVGEEFLFRGVLQAFLQQETGPILAIAITSAMFGLFHPVSRAYIVLAGVIGGYLGLVWFLSGNLLAVIITHAVYDFVALILLIRDEDRDAAESSV